MKPVQSVVHSLTIVSRNRARYQYVELIVEFFIGCGDKTQKWELT